LNFFYCPGFIKLFKVNVTELESLVNSIDISSIISSSKLQMYHRFSSWYFCSLLMNNFLFQFFPLIKNVPFQFFFLNVLWEHNLVFGVKFLVPPVFQFFLPFFIIRYNITLIKKLIDLIFFFIIIIVRRLLFLFYFPASIIFSSFS